MSADWDVDEELLEGCRRGDQKACEAIYARHAPAIITFFRTKVRPEEVEELAQEAAARLFERLAHVERGRLLRAFARGIARNVLLEHIRRARKQGRFDPSHDTLASLDAEPDDFAVGRNEVRLLLVGLRRLPLDEQILLEQFYFEGQTAVAIAEEVALTDNATRNRIRRARLRLEREISQLEAEGPLIASTIEHLDDWARDIREHLRRGSTHEQEQ